MRLRLDLKELMGHDGSMTHVKKVCKICEKEFYVIPYRKDKAKTCSKKCANTLMCLTRRGKGNPAYIDGRKIKSKHGYRVRKYALKKKGNICEKCGSKDNLEVHHKDRNRTNPNLDNLEILCKKCHEKLHSKLCWEERVKCICKWCHKDFRVQVGKFNRGEGKYCSKNCLYSSRKGKIPEWFKGLIRIRDPKTKKFIKMIN